MHVMHNVLKIICIILSEPTCIEEPFQVKLHFIESPKLQTSSMKLDECGCLKMLYVNLQ